MRSFNRVRSSPRFSSRPAQRASLRAVEALEARTLLNATLTSGISTVQVPTNSSPTNIDLTAHFNDPTVVGTAIEIQTPEGVIPLTLYDSQTPKTVTNFVVNYVNTGEYNNVLVHRSVPGFVIQGGGYTPDGTHILTHGTVQGEPGIKNTTGTIAMALSSGPNSGTSEWFINLADNPVLDGTSDGGPFTVFGNVIYNGMSVVNAIAALPIVNDSAQSGAFNTLPVQSGTNGATVSSEPASNMVTTNTSVVSPLIFGASTDNNNLVTPAIASDGTLILTYAPGQTGTAHIIVNATDLGGNVATTTFTVNIGGLPTTPGTIGKGAARVIHFTDPNGVAGTATLIGPGNATLTFTGAGVTTATSKTHVETVTGTPQSISIATTGTTAASVLSITGGVSIAGISTDASIGSISASRVSLSGGLSVAGNAGAINLTAASGGTISATKINRIFVKQGMDANVSATTVGSVSAGSITGSAWTIAQRLTSVSAGSITALNLSAGSVGAIIDRGAATNDTINSSGNIGLVSALSLTGARIYAGGPTLDAGGIPTAFGTDQTISAVVVGKGGFSNSIIGGGTLSRVSLGAVTSANGGTPFGVAAHKILSLAALVDGKRLTLARAASEAQVTAALTKAGITANDLAIRIV